MGLTIKSRYLPAHTVTLRFEYTSALTPGLDHLRVRDQCLGFTHASTMLDVRSLTLPLLVGVSS